MIISGSASGFINSPAGIVSAAKACPGKGGNEETPSTALANARMAVLWQNWRRVIFN
jgi:hypothetical protein